MDVIPQNLRHRPRFLFHRLNRAPQTRLYTKETLNRRRLQGERRPASQAVQAYWAEVDARKAKLPPPPRPEASGKPRDLSSNAAKAERFKESRRIEKALMHEHHGENVYAYAHIRTAQVVYSLTKVMDNNQILRQLVFHGKKTVPASLRRDLWTPYFSLHFPSSYSGLLAYHHLRELSLQRQLKPPDYLIMTMTQSASEKARAKMSKEEEEKWDAENEGKPYPDGLRRLARRHDRAKALMMQKATSVADVAFVADLLQKEGHLRSPASVEEMMKTRLAERLDAAGRRRKKRLRANLKLEGFRENRYKEMTKKAQEGTKWGLERYAAKRISAEHGGIVTEPSIALRKRVSGENGRIVTDRFRALRKVILPEREEDVPKKEDLPQEEAKPKEEAVPKAKAVPKEGAVSEEAAVPKEDAVLEEEAVQRREDPRNEDDIPKEVQVRKEEQSFGQTDTTTLTATTTTTTPTSPPPPPPAPSSSHSSSSSHPPPSIRIFWSDLRDTAYAANWPEIVSHGELERLAYSTRAGKDGRFYFVDRSVHVIGGMRNWMGDDAWMRGERSMPSWRREEVAEEGVDESGKREGEEGFRGFDGEEGIRGSDGGAAGKSREEQTGELEREDVLFEPPPPRSGVMGWVKGRLGMAT